MLYFLRGVREIESEDFMTRRVAHSREFALFCLIKSDKLYEMKISHRVPNYFTPAVDKSHVKKGHFISA